MDDQEQIIKDLQTQVEKLEDETNFLHKLVDDLANRFDDHMSSLANHG
jgi:hypothetical protein